MLNAFGQPGRAFLISGIVPVLALIVLNVALFYTRNHSLMSRLSALNDPTLVGTIVAVALPLGILLQTLNGFIIRACEGALPITAWLLHPWQRRNEREHDRLYRDLLGLQHMHEAARARLAAPTPEPMTDAQSRIDSAAHALDAAYADLEAANAAPALPLDTRRIRPTALGNAYAVMEEYPIVRYGMDPMVFWPRLIAEIDADYRGRLGEQKTNCDVLLHTGVVLMIFAIEAIVLAVIDARWILLALVPLSLALAYALYRAAVSETMTLGTLVAGAFDLYRRQLMARLVAEPPSDLQTEQLMWLGLSAFIRRGEVFYFPRSSLPGTGAPEEAPADGVATTGDG